METNFQDSLAGKLPEDWGVANLEDICTYKKGKKPDEVKKEYSRGFLPYLSTQYLRQNGSHSFAEASENVIMVSEDDIILLWDGSNAGEVFLGKRGILSS